MNTQSLPTIEGLWHVADSVLCPDTKACVVRLHPSLGWLASGRYTTKASAHRAQRTIQARHPESNVYVVIRNGGDGFVIYLDAHTTL